MTDGLQILVAFFVGALVGGWCGWYHGAERWRNKMIKRKIVTRTIRSHNWGPFYVMTWTNPFAMTIQWIGFGKLHPNQCELEVEEEPYWLS